MKVQCPTCKQDVEWSAAATYRPFCSKKCQLIDLGDWASEENRIADKSSPQADQIPDIETIEAMLAEQGDDFFKH